jgi:hypothetical protein
MTADWKFEHAVEVNASREAAWEFWTRVENWAIDPAVERVELDGPFEVGTEGLTMQRSGEPVRWKIAGMREGQWAVIEFKLADAVARFTMHFESVSEDRSRLRQRITLDGPGAKSVAAGLGPGFADGVRDGMQKLADAIEDAATRI